MSHMKRSISAFIAFSVSAFLVTVPFSTHGQEVLMQLGDDESEGWDAYSCTTNGSQVFALGFNRTTVIDGVEFTARERGVVLGRIEEQQVTSWGHLSSRGRTIVHDIVQQDSSIYIQGNAFSFLTYRGDTILASNGENNSFILQLTTSGDLVKHIRLRGKGAILGQGARWSGTPGGALVTLYQFTDTVSVDGESWTAQASTASLVLHWSSDLSYIGGRLIDGSGAIEGEHLETFDDEVFVAGRFKGSIAAATDSIFTRTADHDGFLYVYQIPGNERFIKHLRGQYEDAVYALAVAQDAIYLGGQFIGNIRLGDREILTGLTVAGFIGALDRSGQVLWLDALRGSSSFTSVRDIARREDDLHFIVWSGGITTYRGDSLIEPTEVGQVHSILAHCDASGQLRDWELWVGQPVIYAQSFHFQHEALRITAEMMGQFAGIQSRGSFDALVIDPQSTSSHPLDPTSLPKDYAVYPQPADESLFLAPAPPLKSELFIYDISGRLVYNSVWSSEGIPVAHLPAGKYVLLVVPPTNAPAIRRVWIKN